MISVSFLSFFGAILTSGSSSRTGVGNIFSSKVNFDIYNIICETYKIIYLKISLQYFVHEKIMFDTCRPELYTAMWTIIVFREGADMIEELYEYQQ